MVFLQFSVTPLYESIIRRTIIAQYRFNSTILLQNTAAG